MSIKSKYIIGVDEAGRGPLAGPVSVGVVLVPRDFDWEQLPGVNDSKKLTEKKREVIFDLAQKMQKKGKLRYSVPMVAAKEIDRKGIVSAIKTAMEKGLKKVTQPISSVNRTSKKNNEAKSDGNFSVEIFPTDAQVLLDGSLYAPEEYLNQETIIKGDSKEKVIGLASIMAKVTRDRYMVRRSNSPEYISYSFATHKGYGTKAHRAAIAKYGLSPEHRASYCKNVKML